MIPRGKITRDNVLSAVAEIDANGIPKGREARGFDLLCEGKAYPPKYVISVAVKAATGQALDLSEFTGGEPTNSTLRDLGFDVRRRERQGLRDNLEKVMDRYVAARTGETFGRTTRTVGSF